MNPPSPVIHYRGVFLFLFPSAGFSDVYSRLYIPTEHRWNCQLLLFIKFSSRRTSVCAALRCAALAPPLLNRVAMLSIMHVNLQVHIFALKGLARVAQLFPLWKIVAEGTAPGSAPGSAPGPEQSHPSPLPPTASPRPAHMLRTEYLPNCVGE